MNEVDDAVRTMLTARAAAVPPSPLLDGVHRRIRRHRTRRRALVGAAAAIALLAAGGAVWGAGRSDDRLVPADRPPTSATAAAPPDQGSRGLVPGNPEVPAAPLTPGALPEGFPAPRLTLDTKNRWIYGSTRTAPRPDTSLSIWVSRTPLPPSTGPGTTRTTSVRRGPATLYTATYQQMQAAQDWSAHYVGAYAELSFRYSDTLWVRIAAGHDGQDTPLSVTGAELVAIANGLVATPTPVPGLLRFAGVPEGLVVGAVWAGFPGQPTLHEVQFVSPRAGQQAGNYKPTDHASGDAPLSVVVSDDPEVLSSRIARQVRTIRVGGLTVTVSRSTLGPGRTYYSAPFHGDTITLTVDDDLGLSDATIARFLTGITPGPDY